MTDKLKIENWKLIEKFLIEFLKDEVYKTGLRGAVVGLSGGLDSAIVSVLAQKAFGDRFLAVMLPTHSSSANSLKDAYELINKFSIRHELISIGEYIDVYDSKNLYSSNISRGNFMARMRMATLYDISAREEALVIGTSNKSEILLGYGTIFGDLASAINPIGDLYKSDLFEFAKYLNIPESIISKPPSADLFEGQSDESEIGASYYQIDKIYKLYVEERWKIEKIIEVVGDEVLVKKLISRIYKNQFKRTTPVIAKLTNRTFGHDFLYSRDSGL